MRYPIFLHKLFAEISFIFTNFNSFCFIFFVDILQTTFVGILSWKFPVCRFRCEMKSLKSTHVFNFSMQIFKEVSSCLSKSQLPVPPKQFSIFFLQWNRVTLSLPSATQNYYGRVEKASRKIYIY